MARQTETLLGFDFGLRRIGVATGQALTRTASPLMVLKRTGDRTDWDGIAALVREWRPTALVVGLPRHPDGATQAMTGACRRFASELEGRTRLPVIMVEEGLSSRDAESDFVALRRAGAVRRRDRGRLDAVAAQRILETYLNDPQA